MRLRSRLANRWSQARARASSPAASQPSPAPAGAAAPLVLPVLRGRHPPLRGEPGDVRQLAVGAATGRPCWTHKAVGEFWASPLVADGKVYVGTRRGQFLTFAAGREKRLLGKVDVGAGVNGTAAAANGVLYVPTMTTLYAVANAQPVGGN